MSNEVFEIRQHLKDPLPAKLLYVTKAKYDKDWHSTSHTHHFTELLFITKGKGSFIFSHQEVPVSENDLIIINPNVEHTEKSSACDDLQYIALGVEGLSVFDAGEAGAEVSFYNYKEDRQTYLFLLGQLIDEVETEKDNYELIVQSLMEVLLLKMMRTKKFSVEKTPVQKMNKNIAYIKNFIKLHFREDINLDILAEASHINKYYLSHLFKKSVGVSPIEYLIQTRIRESKILLETTNYPISDIADITGFSSQSFFSQSFKRVTEVTPSQYRSRNAKMKKE